MSYLQRLLGEGEEVLFITRQHWTAFLGRCWRMLLLFVLALAVAVFLNLELKSAVIATSQAALDVFVRQNELLTRVGIVVVLLTYPVIALLLRYQQWQAEQYVVTDRRVIQLSGILSKRVLDSSLDKVNDVKLEQSLLGRMLDYGDLEILTASELAVNDFQRVARPLAFKAFMLNAKQRLEAAGRDGRDDPAKLIAELARLRDQQIITDEEFQEKKAKLLGQL